MPEFDYVRFEGADGTPVPQTPPQPDDLEVDRRDFLWRSALVAGIGAAGVIVSEQLPNRVLPQYDPAREHLVRIEGFAAGANSMAQAAQEAERVKEYTNDQIVRQLMEGRQAVPYFGGVILRGTVNFFVSEERIPVVIENPILPMGTTPLIEDDPSSFWILYQDWHYPDGTPRFRSFWPGGKGVTMEFADSEPEQVVDLAVSSGKSTGRLDRVRVVNPATGQPLDGLPPIGLMRGIPRPSAPADLRYA